MVAARLDGADGFEQAMQQHERTGTPIALFVYTDWCPHCRTLIQKVLETPTVREYMSGISEVWLNPETGNREQALAATYGIRGYPTFLMFPRDSTQPREIDRMVQRAGRWELKSPSEFVEACQAAAGPPRRTSRPAASTRAHHPAQPRTPSSRETSTRLAASHSDAPAVTLYLTDGKVVKGRLTGETAEVVLVDVGNGQEIYFRTMIERMVKDEPPAAPQPQGAP